MIPTINRPIRLAQIAGYIFTLFILNALPAHADYRDDVSYSVLATELGAGIPDGTGVPVSLVEAATLVDTVSVWMPDPNNAEFSGKTIIDVSGAVPDSYSGHATGAGKKLYGNITSTSAGITNIAAYNASHWLGDGFLRINTGGWPNYQPRSSSSRISNHSWIADAGTYSEQGLTRLDWTIEADEMLQVAGFTGSASNPLLGSAYNVIAVNSTHTPTNSGSATVGGIYTTGRTKPEIVAPAANTSSATPRVASAAALLVEAAHDNPSWSTDPATIASINRNGDTIYNAERVEVIKAALLAGADRTTSNSTSTDITNYRVNAVDQTTNGLDRRFGAGQLNVYNSYHIIAAGEQNSSQDQAGSGGLIGLTGFDYDPAFGGSQGSNATANYHFSPTTGPARITASLVWNLAIDGGSPNNFNESATLYDLDLHLYDSTDPSNWVSVNASASTTDNTENLWLLLESGKNYTLQVKRSATQAAFKWDYGLAWQVTPVTPLTIDPIVLPQGYFGEAYPPQTLTAANGQPPYTWAITEGALRPGMTLSPDGVISGTPTAITTAYDVAFTVQVTDAAANTATLELLLDVKVRPFRYRCYSCHDTGSF